MGVQLELDGTKLWSTRLQTSVGSGCLSARRLFFLPAFATGFPERAKKRFRAKFILPAIDGSTVKQKLFLVACWCLRWRGRLWFHVGRWISHPDHDLHYSRSRAERGGRSFGLLVLGYGGFYAIGAYTFALSITITVWASGPVCRLPG